MFSSRLSIFSLTWGKAWYQVQCLSVLHGQNRGGKAITKRSIVRTAERIILKKKIKKHLQWRFMPTNLHTIIVRNFCSCFSKRACPVLPACAGHTATPPTSGASGSHRVSHGNHRNKRMTDQVVSGATESNFFFFFCPLIKWMQNISVSSTGGKVYSIKKSAAQKHS